MKIFRVFRLTKHTLFKEAFSATCEAETMCFISQNTSVPIPKVIYNWLMYKSGYEGIVMEFIQGRLLDTAWPSLNDDQKSHLKAQLQGYISELRSLTPPENLSGQICSLNGGPFFDPLLLGQFCGPFKFEQELNEFCLFRFSSFIWDPSTRTQVDANWVKLFANHRIMFTHSDLNPRNILVDDQNNIISILDWEMVGWKPEQWEYLKATWIADPDGGWPAFMQQVIPGYQVQLDLHIEMCIMHGSPF